MELLQKFIIQVTTLQGPTAVVFFIIMLGYALKMVPDFPNRFIPLISFMVGPPLTLILVAWPSVGSMEPGIRWPEVAAWATSLIQGFLLACLAWISHAKVLRKLIDEKIPALTPGRQVESATASETRTDDGVTLKVEAKNEVVTEVIPAPKEPETIV